MTVRIRSRIMEFLSRPLQEELLRICKSSIVSDNNAKIPLVLQALKKHNVDFVELGPGTNRLAVLIDNYVFKIALDKWGMKDNNNEFVISKELQPFAVKTYENNELISVCEYITVISREEFIDKKEEIQEILAELAQSYLLGDVGTVPKNFCNWGYRDDGQLVILDFAYIHRVKGDELLCSNDQDILEYDENYYNLICPTCRRKYSFMDLRRRITLEEEQQEYEVAKEFAYEMTKPMQEFDTRYNEDEHIDSSSLYTSHRNIEEENQMPKNKNFIPYDEDEVISDEEAYLRALEELNGPSHSIEDELTDEEMEVLAADAQERINAQNKETSIIEVHRQSGDETTHVRVVHQGESEISDAVEKIIESATEIANEVEHSEPEFSVTETGNVQAQDVELYEGEGVEPYYSREHTSKSDGVELYEHEHVEPTETGFVAERETRISDDTASYTEYESVRTDNNQVQVERVEQSVTTIITDGTEDQETVDEETEEGQDEGDMESTSEADSVNESVEDKEEGLTVIPPRNAGITTVAQSSIRISDDVTVTSTVKIHSEDETQAEKLRQELLGGSTIQIEQRPKDKYDAEIAELYKDNVSGGTPYQPDDHDEYEDWYDQNAMENNRRKGGNGKWE